MRVLVGYIKTLMWIVEAERNELNLAMKWISRKNARDLVVKLIMRAFVYVTVSAQTPGNVSSVWTVQSSMRHIRGCILKWNIGEKSLFRRADNDNYHRGLWLSFVFEGGGFHLKANDMLSICLWFQRLKRVVFEGWYIPRHLLSFGGLLHSCDFKIFCVVLSFVSFFFVS